MNKKHPLLEKTLIKSPCNWKEWLEHWNSTNDPFALFSLLKFGSRMNTQNSYDYESEKKADILYLRLAKNFWEGEQVFHEVVEFNEKINIFNGPKSVLAKTSFKILCENCFRKTESNRNPWRNYLYDKDLLGELLVFLGVGSIAEPWKSEFHSLMCYAHKNGEILKEFSLGLAEHLIEIPHDSLTNLDDDRKTHLTSLWKAKRKSAIMILWYFNQLERVLIKHRDKIDRSVFNSLKDIILKHDIVLPNRRKPKNVREVLEMKNDSYFYYHNQDLMRAAHFYLSMTL